ncbi:MAG: type I 3-dehydroquinate dehydratase [Candidatus Moranbacteria bacterium]|nr:type I 3-dehydroquinate dehydratase [Candidatus Moranbacteria bacterium]
MIKIAAVVQGKTLNEFLNNLQRIQEKIDLLELRIDYIKNIKPKNLSIIKKSLKKPCILTCRKKNQGGFFSGKEKDRLKIIQKAIDLEFDHIDIELESIYKINLTNSLKPKVICSFHDFEKTPSYEKLEKIKGQMTKTKANIYKIAVFANKKSDNLKLFKLLLNKKQSQKMIVIAMGEKGKISRIIAPLLGSYLTFASFKNSKSAPGQIEFEKLKNIYKTLNVN